MVCDVVIAPRIRSRFDRRALFDFFAAMGTAGFAHAWGGGTAAGTRLRHFASSGTPADALVQRRALSDYPACCRRRRAVTQRVTIAVPGLSTRCRASVRRRCVRRRTAWRRAGCQLATRWLMLHIYQR